LVDVSLLTFTCRSSPCANKTTLQDFRLDIRVNKENSR
jgi:hypothetical protein